MSLFRKLIALLLAVPVTGVLADTECGILCDEDWWDSASIDDVKLALENGKRLDSLNEYGNSPLHFALKAGKGLDHIKLLLENGSDIGAQGYNDLTSLHTASRYASDPEIISLLLSNGANLKAKTITGITPLHAAATLNPEPEITDLLLRSGAVVQIQMPWKMIMDGLLYI